MVAKGVGEDVPALDLMPDADVGPMGPGDQPNQPADEGVVASVEDDGCGHAI